jgi:hypothetical protein
MDTDPYDNIQPEKISKKEKELPVKGKKRGPRLWGVSPGVKKFAYFGLAIVAFSILYKHNFNPEAIKAEVNLLWAKTQARLISGKAKKAKEGINKAALISVVNFDGSQKPGTNKDLKVEGIFFDADGGSFIVLNGKVIAEGQSWMGVMVKKISRESVEVEVNGESRILGVE